jgi:ribosomal protein S21
MINVEVQANNNENSMSVIRRFSRRVNESGILKKKRSIRYRNKPASKTQQRKQTLRSIDRKKEVEKLIKLGKISENRRNR